MFYTVIIVIPCFVFCALGAVPVDERRYLPKAVRGTSDAGLLSGNGKGVGEAMGFVGSQRANSRPRRSLWTSLVDDLASAFGTFRMKPLLAGAAGETFNEVIHRDGPRPVNAMLISIDGRYGHLVDKNIIDPQVQILYTIMRNYMRTYQKLVMRESNLVNQIVKNKNIEGNIDFSDLYVAGLNTVKAERLLSIVFANNMKFKSTTTKELFKLRRLRQILQKALSAFDKTLKEKHAIVVPRYHRNIDEVQKQLNAIIDLNDEWLKFESKFKETKTRI